MAGKSNSTLRPIQVIDVGDRQCAGTNRFGEQCRMRAGTDVHSDGQYYCPFHGDNKYKHRCLRCGRVRLKDYDLCGRCNGVSRKRRRYPNGHKLKHNMVVVLDKGLIKQKERALGKVNDPLKVANQTLVKSIAILELAVEDFEKIRAGEVTKNGNQPIEAGREDIIFISDQVEKVSRTAERTLNMMAKKALTDKELRAAHDRVLRVMKELITTFVPRDKRKAATEFATTELRK